MSICDNIRKKEILQEQFLNINKNFLNIGLKKLRKKLNLISGDYLTQIYKLILEIEILSIKAKLSNNNKFNLYEKKKILIYDLIYLAEKHNINYGFQESDCDKANSIVFFDLPIGQISWHSMLDHRKYNKYNGKWDGELNSTFIKLERYFKGLKEFS